MTSYPLPDRRVVKSGDLFSLVERETNHLLVSPCSAPDMREVIAKRYPRRTDASLLPAIDWNEAYDNGYYVFSVPGVTTVSWSRADWMAYVEFIVPITIPGIVANAPYQHPRYVVTDEEYREAYEEYVERRRSYSFTVDAFNLWLSWHKSKGN